MRSSSEQGSPYGARIDHFECGGQARGCCSIHLVAAPSLGPPNLNWPVARPFVSARETAKTSPFRPFQGTSFISLGMLAFEECEMVSPACRVDVQAGPRARACHGVQCACVGAWVGQLVGGGGGGWVGG